MRLGGRWLVLGALSVAAVGSLAVASSASALQNAEPIDPKPQPATAAILAAYDQYDIVGTDAAHGDEVLDDYLLTLIESPHLRERIDDIVVECGNRAYQGVLDRYIAGGEVSTDSGMAALRTTALGMCGLSRFYERLFPLVRQLNQATPNHRVRLLVTEPPVDWSASSTEIAAARRANRDSCIAAAMEADVLAHHHKALMLFGSEHLEHRSSSGRPAVSIYEARYPGKTFVMHAHGGFAAFMGLDRGTELEARMTSWPRPSIVVVKGTWLADLDLPYFAWPFPKRMAGESFTDHFDAFLYLGPADSLTLEPPSDMAFTDSAFRAHLRAHLGITLPSQPRPPRRLVSDADIREARSFLPGAPLVGTWADSVGTDSFDIDYALGKLCIRRSGSRPWSELIMTAPEHFRGELSGTPISLEVAMSGDHVTSIITDSRRVLHRRPERPPS